MLISHMNGRWGGHYYTPRTQTVILRDYRTVSGKLLNTSAQQTAIKDFFSRSRTKVQVGLESNKTFGSSDFSSGTSEKKTLFGAIPSSRLHLLGHLHLQVHPAGVDVGSSGSGLFGGGGGRSWGGRGAKNANICLD